MRRNVSKGYSNQDPNQRYWQSVNRNKDSNLDPFLSEDTPPERKLRTAHASFIFWVVIFVIILGGLTAGMIFLTT